MRRLILILPMIALTMSSLVACGIDADVHDAVVGEKEAAQAAVAQHEELGNLLEQENKSMRADLTEAEATIAGVVGEKEAAQTSVTQLEQENKSMRADLTEAEATIQDLKAVHPPRRFKDRIELETWLRNDDISERSDVVSAEAWLGMALEQQARALEDGYIVSAEYYPLSDGMFQVWVSTVAENMNYFSWDPESDEVLFGANINQLPVE